MVLSPFPGRRAVAEPRKWHGMKFLLTVEFLWLHKVTSICTEDADTKSGMEKLLSQGHGKHFPPRVQRCERKTGSKVTGRKSFLPLKKGEGT